MTPRDLDAGTRHPASPIEGRAFIDGRYRAAKNQRAYAKTVFLNGYEQVDIADAGESDAADAVGSARQAFEDRRWRGLALKERKRILLQLAMLMEQHGQELAELEARDMGKPVRNGLAVDIPSAAECISWYAETLDKVPGEVAPVDGPGMALVRREPLGVVAAVVPWNFPLLMACWKIAPALAAGNSVVLKPSERAPLSAIRLAGLAHQAGLPPGVLNVLPGRGETAGRALGLHPDVDCVLFTGSTAVGKQFLAYAAASNLKAVWPECGGKSAQIVFPDADLDRAARGVANGIFFNQGQVCNAGSRLLVHRSIHGSFLDRLMAQARRMEPGDPLDPRTRFGPLVDEAHCAAVADRVEEAVRQGADPIFGGMRLRLDGRGSFFAPTLLDRVLPEMAVWREEVFGPVLSIMTFTEEEEAVHLANDSPYGIAAAAWTADAARGQRLAGALRAGTVWLNGFDLHSIATPFGGFRQSGYGRDRSLHALAKVTGLKTVWINP